jgi:hypothetical protein
MSIYAAHNHEPGEQIASNWGWSQFVQWAEKQGPALKQLVRYGTTNMLDELRTELVDAPDYLRGTAGALLVVIAESEEAVFITNGLSTSDAE